MRQTLVGTCPNYLPCSAPITIVYSNLPPASFLNAVPEQGQRILIDEHQAQIVVVPSRLLLASLNPTLVGLLLAQQVESDMAYHRQDLGTMVLTDATSIFIEADVQHIM